MISFIGYGDTEGKTRFFPFFSGGHDLLKLRPADFHGNKHNSMYLSLILFSFYDADVLHIFS